MRPGILIKDATLYWSVILSDSSGDLLDAGASALTVSVRKNGVAVADTVSITEVARGHYRCSYNPASETFGDSFEIVESVTGYDAPFIWSFVVVENATVIGLLNALQTTVDDIDLSTVEQNVSSVKAKTDQLVFTVANQVDSNALTGGGGSVTVYPIQTTAIARVTGTTLTAYTSESVEFTITPTDSTGASIDTTAMTLEVVIEDRNGVDLQVIANGSIVKTSTTYAFTSSSGANATGTHKWSCRRTDTDEVIGHGDYIVEYAATKDT